MPRLPTLGSQHSPQICARASAGKRHCLVQHDGRRHAAGRQPAGALWNYAGHENVFSYGALFAVLVSWSRPGLNPDTNRRNMRSVVRGFVSALQSQSEACAVNGAVYRSPWGVAGLNVSPKLIPASFVPHFVFGLLLWGLDKYVPRAALRTSHRA